MQHVTPIIDQLLIVWQSFLHRSWQ